MRGNPIRKPVLVVVASGVVLVVALLCWFFLTARAPGRFEKPGVRTDILLAVVSEQGVTDPLVVLSVGADSDDLFLFVSSDLRIKLPDGTFTRLGDTYGEDGMEGMRDRLAEFLGIDLPYYVGIDDSAFKDLIDSIGGLSVQVEGEVVYSDPESDPPAEVHILPGEQGLDGETALAYLRGQPEAGRTGRAGKLLGAIVEEGFVSCERRKVDRTLRSISGEVETNLPPADLYALADSLRGLDPMGLRMPSVPGERVTIDGETYLQPKVVETERLVASSLKGLELLTPSEVKVAVFNGNGLKLMATRTADYLKARGFQITRIGNADTFSYEMSYIVVLTDEAKAWILRDALPSPVKIVFPDAFSDHYEALKGLIPIETDLILIAGASLEIDE